MQSWGGSGSLIAVESGSKLCPHLSAVELPQLEVHLILDVRVTIMTSVTTMTSQGQGVNLIPHVSVIPMTSQG